MEKNKTNVLIALVGESGAGKSVAAKYLEDFYGMKYLRSYTTREKRADNIDDHTYVNLTQYSRIINKVAENHSHGNWYCATESQCNDADVYVVDVTGLKMLKENYHNKPVVAFYIETPLATRIQRMKYRGDTTANIDERLKNDKFEFDEALKYCDYTVNNEGDLAMTCREIMNKVEEFVAQKGETTETVDQNS